MGTTIPSLLEETERTKLPSLPHVLIKLLKACQKDTACFDTLVEIITKDAALSAKVLTVANSTVYGRAREQSSFKQILIYLGFDTVKSIAITAAVQQFFSSYSKEKSRFLKIFWEHSFYTAIVAKSLAKITSYSNAEEAYQAGLLHDIGKLVFENHSKDDYSVLIGSGTSTDELLKHEQEKYSTTHDVIAGRLLERWELPDVISEAVKYHHASNLDIPEAHHLVKIINLASHITASNKLNSDELNNYSQTLFDLSDSTLNDIVNDAKSEVKKIAATYEIDIGAIHDGQDNSEEKQIELAQEIRNISLIQGAMQLLKEDVEGIDFAAIQKSTMILFGLDKCCLFLYDDDNNMLTIDNTTTHMNKSILGAFEVKADSSSLMAETINSNKIKSFFTIDENVRAPVIDKQIISAFKTDGIVCVPLIKSGFKIGVVVIGVNKNQYQHLIEKTSLLELYSSEIANQVFTARSGQKIRKDFIHNNQQQIKSRAREIIHEVNNPLAIIRNYLTILAGRLDKDDPAQNDLDVISEEIDRVGNIILKCDEEVEQIEINKEYQKVDVNELILSIHNIMESSLYATHKVKSQLNLGKEIGFVNINKNLLKQVLTNLIKNAVEAMSDKKEIFVATMNVNINGKDFLEIEISDTGSGIPENILKNLYKPVTSTKGKRHSGLGLSIVKKLVDEMDGDISCKTDEAGTTFNIHFPLTDNN
jgi:putative nucleotidyltransferase with HDIG domain